jgi:hypothetical protein
MRFYVLDPYVADWVLRNAWMFECMTAMFLEKKKQSYSGIGVFKQRLDRENTWPGMRTLKTSGGLTRCSTGNPIGKHPIPADPRHPIAVRIDILSDTTVSQRRRHCMTIPASEKPATLSGHSS